MQLSRQPPAWLPTSSTKGIKVVTKGGTKAKKKDTRVAVNGMTMPEGSWWQISFKLW